MRKIFEEKVMIAKKDSLLLDDTKIDSKSYNKLVKLYLKQVKMKISYLL